MGSTGRTPSFTWTSALRRMWMPVSRCRSCGTGDSCISSVVSTKLIVLGWVSREQTRPPLSRTRTISWKEDVTPYVLSLGGQITASRQISLVLSNPEEVLTQPSRLLGSSPLRALRAEIKAGFWTSVGECLVSVLEGDVISVDEDHSLPVIRLPIAVRDSSNLPGLVGTSDATEWPGLAFGGDNYAPRTTDDTLGASGLGHTALHGGSWTGSTGGLSMEANGKEGAAYTTFISRAFLGTLTAEISFYKSINQVNMSVLGIQPTQVAS